MQTPRALFPWVPRVSPLVYLALAALGIALLGESAYQHQRAQVEAHAFKTMLDRQFGDNAKIGFRFDLAGNSLDNVGRTDIFDFSKPLNISDSKALSIVLRQYDGDCTQRSAISSISVELHAPAFVIDSLDNERRSFSNLVRNFCSLTDNGMPSADPYRWILVPKKAGQQVIFVRIVSKDAAGHDLADSVIEIPAIVHDPPDLSIFIGLLSGVAGLAGSILPLFNRKPATLTQAAA